MDSGSSVGEISGHSKPINAVAMRAQRPFRAVTASDDSTLAFFHGVPYKVSRQNFREGSLESECSLWSSPSTSLPPQYQKSINTHTKFVQDVSYAPSGGESSKLLQIVNSK